MTTFEVNSSVNSTSSRLLPRNKKVRTWFELLGMWTMRDIRIRYKQSFLGVVWAILQPFALMVMFTFVFSFIAPISTGDIPYPIFSYTGVLPWTLLATTITTGIPSLVNNMNLVTKVKMPREIIPIGAAIASLVDFFVASLIFVGMMIGYQVTVHWVMLWIIPLLGIQLTLGIGITLGGSALNVLYRDIRFIVPLGIQLWMYASPIIYPIDLIPEKWRPLYYLNPMAGILEGYRNVILHGIPPNLLATWLAFFISVVAIAIGYRIFRRIEPKFADVI